MLLIPGRIPVRADPIFWVLILLIGWLNSMTLTGTLIWAFVIFYSVLIHEFGHALTAVYFGQKARISLVGMGGLTQRSGKPISLWKEFLIVFNGPAAGLALFYAAFQLSSYLGTGSPQLLSYLLGVTVWVNLFWTLVNLLPIQPLDGGHLLRIFLEGLLGHRGVKLAMLTGFLFAGAVSLLFFSIGAFLVGAILLLFAFENFRGWQSIRSITPKDRDQPLQKAFLRAEQEFKSGDRRHAVEQLEKIRESTQTGMLFLAATELLAEAQFDEENYDGVYQLLHPLQDRISPKSLQLLHQVLYKKEKWQQAVTLGNELFRTYPNATTALVNSLCHSRLGEIQPAVGWLETATREGLGNLPEILRKKDYDPIRSSPEFQSLLHP